MHLIEPCTQRKDTYARPFVKWAGGKGQLLEELINRVPDSFSRYYEPFIGGGALFYKISPEKAVIADLNPELVNTYIVVRDDVESLISSLCIHQNTPDYFYSTRALDISRMTPVERASRFIYLNKTCYNGLWRVNSKGHFNVPYGKYKNPLICDADNLRLVSQALIDTDIRECDFEQAVFSAQKNDFIYFDPPYYPLSKTAYFTGYVKNGFGPDEQRRLVEVFNNLSDKGCKVMLSNSNTEFVKDLYSNFRITEVKVNRAINCKGDRRTGLTELIITNY